jgi:hypothetical protein
MQADRKVKRVEPEIWSISAGDAVRPMPSARRLPPPWTLEEMNDACFIVKDQSASAAASDDVAQD